MPAFVVWTAVLVIDGIASLVAESASEFGVKENEKSLRRVARQFLLE